MSQATTFSGLWAELVTESKAEVVKWKAEVVDFENYIVPVIEADVVSVLSEFRTLAVQTVLEFAKAEFDNLTGHEKQSEVVTRVFQAAEASGKHMVISDAQMLAQQAFRAVSHALAGGN